MKKQSRESGVMAVWAIKKNSPDFTVVWFVNKRMVSRIKSKSAWVLFTVWVPVGVKGKVSVLTTLEVLCYNICTPKQFFLHLDILTLIRTRLKLFLRPENGFRPRVNTDFVWILNGFYQNRLFRNRIWGFPIFYKTPTLGSLGVPLIYPLQYLIRKGNIFFQPLSLLTQSRATPKARRWSARISWHSPLTFPMGTMDAQGNYFRTAFH